MGSLLKNTEVYLMAKSPTHIIVETIIRRLFEKDQQMITCEITKLTQMNAQIKYCTAYGFTFKGKTFISDAYPYDGVRQGDKHYFPVISIHLQKELWEFESLYNKFQSNKEKVKQSLSNLLGSSATLQDLRNYLPDCICQMLPELNDYQRTVERNTIKIENMPAAMRNYEKALEIMQACRASDFLL